MTMRTFFKSIAMVAVMLLVSFSASAQESAVDKVAQLDDVYNFYMPASMIKGIGNLGDIDILKATPIPTGMLKKVRSMQFIMAGKKSMGITRGMVIGRVNCCPSVSASSNEPTAANSEA